MNSLAVSKTYRLFYAGILILMMSFVGNAQMRERVVDWHSQVSGAFKAGGCGHLIPTQLNALEAVEIKVGDKLVEFGKPFLANEDWLKNLSVKVKNVSGKPISSIRIGFSLPEAVIGEVRMGFSMVYGKGLSIPSRNREEQRVILPGEEVILAQDEDYYIHSSKAIAQRTGKTNFSKTVLGMTMVKFEDGMIWSNGRLPMHNVDRNDAAKVVFSEPSGHGVSGTVRLKKDGRAAVDAVVAITSISVTKDKNLPFRDCAITDGQGRWAINNVPDGEYLISVVPPFRQFDGENKIVKNNETTPASNTRFVAETFKIKMAGADIADLEVQVNEGGRISGIVTMDDGSPLPKNLIVLLEQTAEKDRKPMRFAAVQPDGSFTLEGVPAGGIYLKAVVYGKANEYFTKSATMERIDLLREPLWIEDGAEVKNVRIVFAKVKEK